MNDDRDKIKLNSYKNYMKFLKIDIKKNCKWKNYWMVPGQNGVGTKSVGQ